MNRESIKVGGVLKVLDTTTGTEHEVTVKRFRDGLHGASDYFFATTVPPHALDKGAIPDFYCLIFERDNVMNSTGRFKLLSVETKLSELDTLRAELRELREELDTLQKAYQHLVECSSI